MKQKYFFIQSCFLTSLHTGFALWVKIKKGTTVLIPDVTRALLTRKRILPSFPDPRKGATCSAPRPYLLPLLPHLFWMAEAAGSSWKTLNYLLRYDFCNEMLSLSSLAGVTLLTPSGRPQYYTLTGSRMNDGVILIQTRALLKVQETY